MSDINTVSSNDLSPDSALITSGVYDAILNDLATTLHALDTYVEIGLEEHLILIEENQNKLLEFLEDHYDVPVLTDEELLLQEEKELAQKEYEEDLLQTLKNIESGIISQNSLLEENNRLLEESTQTVSENSVSQNSIMTTKLEDYSLTDSLLLMIFLALLVGILTFVFAKKGD